MAREKDHNKEFVSIYGPTCRVTVNGQTMGYTGTDIYRLYGATEDNNKFSFGVSQSGKMEINSDVSIEIVAGENNGKKETKTSFMITDVGGISSAAGLGAIDGFNQALKTA